MGQKKLYVLITRIFRVSTLPIVCDRWDCEVPIFLTWYFWSWNCWDCRAFRQSEDKRMGGCDESWQGCFFESGGHDCGGTAQSDLKRESPIWGKCTCESCLKDSWIVFRQKSFLRYCLMKSVMGNLLNVLRISFDLCIWLGWTRFDKAFSRKERRQVGTKTTSLR